MSTLQHTCEDCGHYERAHYRAGDFTRCRCCHNDTLKKSAKPVITPTFDASTFEPEPLLPPGQTYNGGTMSAVRTCGCQACLDAYAAATG